MSSARYASGEERALRSWEDLEAEWVMEYPVRWHQGVGAAQPGELLVSRDEEHSMIDRGQVQVWYYSINVADQVPYFKRFSREAEASCTCGALTYGRDMDSAFEVVGPIVTRPRSGVETDVATVPMSPGLEEALQELNEVFDDAREMGVEVPTETAYQNARRLLVDMYGISPQQYTVYPIADGDIAIDVRDDNGRMFVMLCESNGEVLCLFSSDGEDRRARYSTTSKLPDGFVREALNEIARDSHS